MARRASTASKLRHERSTLSLLPGRATRIVAVADTHSAPHPSSAKHIGALCPDYILHAGDIGDLSVLAGLAEIAPLTAVRGNIDTRAALPDALTIDLRDEDGHARLTLLLMHIALYGPKLRADAARLARADSAALVVCGHSHVPFLGRDKGIFVMNPGSIGPRRFQLPILFGFLEIGSDSFSMHHVSCETGEKWSP